MFIDSVSSLSTSPTDPIRKHQQSIWSYESSCRRRQERQQEQNAPITKHSTSPLYSSLMLSPWSMGYSQSPLLLTGYTKQSSSPYSKKMFIGWSGVTYTILLMIAGLSLSIASNHHLMVMANPTSSSSTFASSTSPSSSSSNDNNNDNDFTVNSLVGTNDVDASSSLSSSSPLNRMNGEQFVQLFDRLMDGELTRIIDQIQSRNNKLDSIPLNKLSARQYINLLDSLSSGAVWRRIQAYFQQQQQQQQQQQRERRSSALDSMSGYSIGYSKRNLDPMTGLSFGSPSKRGINFDEIDRAGFSGFAKRRGGAVFDEIDHSGFAGFTKRRGPSSSDFDEMDHSGFAGFAKRFSDFDEIDRAGFTGFAKRSTDFDEIDRAGFAGFIKRSPPNYLDGASFAFDEMDRSGFNGFAKRLNFDELDHSGFNGFGGQGRVYGYGKRFVMNPVLNMMNKAKMQAFANKQYKQQEQNERRTQAMAKQSALKG